MDNYRNGNWHIGVPGIGERVVIVYWIECLEEWTSRIVRVNKTWQDIVKSSQNTSRPCRWIFAPNLK